MKKAMPPPESRHQDTVQSPVSNLPRKVQKGNTGNMMDMSKNGRKATNRKYDEETVNGGAVTKRRKTRSTVIYADPRNIKKVATPKVTSPKSSVKGARTMGYPQPTNIGDLFSEGSLNPYADGDDPYAFD